MATTLDQPFDSAECEIVTTRRLQASRELVFEAFRDPQHLAQWWGPDGFTNTFSEFDLRPGGHWRFVMHGPDGADYPNHSVFDEVVPPERIVFRHVDPEHEYHMTITLAERDGQTEMTWRMRHPTAEKCARIRPFVTAANEQNLDRLENCLAAIAAKP